jgi:RNA recognition motif-containing protein
MKPVKASVKSPIKPKSVDIKSDQTVYISNLSYNRDEKGLRNLFSRYGKVFYVKIIIDLTTRKSNGMAFVRMVSSEEAEKAILGLNQQVIDGRTVKASFAIAQIPKKPKKIEKETVEKEKPQVSKAEKKMNKIKAKSEKRADRLKRRPL